MAILIILFIERYIRELVSIARKKPLQIWVNWMEALIFLIYFIFSIMTAITHMVYIVREYNHEREEREKTPNEYTNRMATLEQLLSIEIIEVLIHVYIIVDKGTHFLHAGHSVSLFLEKAQHIPKHAHPGHGQENHHDHHHYNRSYMRDVNPYEVYTTTTTPAAVASLESDEESYDDYIGKTKFQTKKRRSTTSSIELGEYITTNSNRDVLLLSQLQDNAFERLREEGFIIKKI